MTHHHTRVPLKSLSREQALNVIRQLMRNQNTKTKIAALKVVFGPFTLRAAAEGCDVSHEAINQQCTTIRNAIKNAPALKVPTLCGSDPQYCRCSNVHSQSELEAALR